MDYSAEVSQTADHRGVWLFDNTLALIPFDASMMTSSMYRLTGIGDVARSVGSIPVALPWILAPTHARADVEAALGGGGAVSSWNAMSLTDCRDSGIDVLVADNSLELVVERQQLLLFLNHQQQQQQRPQHSFEIQQQGTTDRVPLFDCDVDEQATTTPADECQQLASHVDDDVDDDEDDISESSSAVSDDDEIHDTSGCDDEMQSLHPTVRGIGGNSDDDDAEADDDGSSEDAESDAAATADVDDIAAGGLQSVKAADGDDSRDAASCGRRTKQKCPRRRATPDDPHFRGVIVRIKTLFDGTTSRLDISSEYR